MKKNEYQEALDYVKEELLQTSLLRDVSWND